MHNSPGNILSTSTVWAYAIFRYAMLGVGQSPSVLEWQKSADKHTYIDR